ncbi:MAG: hypothetical protein IJX50_01670 [Clostridia bacterium]|nr:hypothetical protein [Clostridia bacterium]
MVDTIRLRVNILKTELEVNKWKTEINEETGEFYYYTFIKAIRLAFYPDTKNLIITGRYISTYTNDKFKNFDDIFSTKNEILEFFFNLESYINSYFITPVVNILTNKVTRLDYCMNVETENAKEYIEFFNMYYNTKPKKLQSYINHTAEHKLPIDSSFYLKTERQYKDKKNQNFTLNIYSKSNELISKRKKQICKFGSSSISEEDILEAENILRIEVQLHYSKLKTTCEKFNINSKKCCLYDLFDIEIAQYVLANELKRFFTEADFYSYEKAKEEIQLKIKNHKSKKAALEYIEAVSKNNKVNSITIPKNLISIGIFPHYFIPRNWNIDILQNPIKLIDEKIHVNQLQWLSLKKGGNSHDKKT